MDAFMKRVVAVLPRLEHRARLLTGDPEAAEDLLQDVVVLAIQQQRNFAEGQDLVAWLTRLMHDRALHLAQQKDMTEASVEEDLRRLSVPRIENSQTWRHKLAQFIRRLERLPQRYRDPFALVVVVGYKHREAAQQLGITPRAVQYRVARARVLLEELEQRNHVAAAKRHYKKKR